MMPRVQRAGIDPHRKVLGSTMAKKDGPYKSFPGDISELLRNLSHRAGKAIKKRGELFTSRDSLLEQRQKLAKNENTKRERLSDQIVDCYEQIKELNNTIKWCDNTMRDAVRNADQSELFDIDVNPKPGTIMFDRDDGDDDGEEKDQDKDSQDKGHKPPASLPFKGVGAPRTA